MSANTISPQTADSSFWLTKAAKPIFFFLTVLTLAGIYAAFQVPISVFPDTNFPRVVIGVDNGVMPVEQMQVTITKPIEDAMNSVPGLVTVRSTTSRGSAEVSLFFDWNVDMFRTLQLTDAALSKIQSELPSTAKLTTNRLTFATFPIIGYALVADDKGPATISQTDLWQLATYDLKPPLNRVAGVSTVIVQGGQVPEFHIVPDPAKLQAAGVTILDLQSAVQNSNIIDSPGLYNADHELILALISAQAHNAEELGQLVVKTTPGGAPVHISDVATVGPAVLPIYTMVQANGKPSVLLNIARQPTSNTVTVATGVALKVAELSKNLPAGVHLVPFYDQSELVRDSIASVRDAILIGLLLACLILFLFLRDWTSSLIAGLVIPVTVAITILFLWAIGESFNLMTLGGLAAAIGLVIDDAIVVVENIVVHRDSGQTRAEAVRSALREIMVPLVGSTITPVVVFLPLVAVTGVTGTFFRALALTMTASLLTSLFLALTFTPALSLSLLRQESSGKDHDHENGPVMTQILKVHGKALSWTIGKPWAIAAIAVILLVAGYFAYSGLGTNLLPAMDEGAFIMDCTMPAGSSLEASAEVFAEVDKVLKATPEVEITTKRTGLQLGLAAVTESNYGDYSVRLKSDRKRPIDEIINDVRERVKDAVPQLDVEYTQVLEDMIGDLSNSPEPIQVKLFGNDANLLHELGPKVQAAIKEIPGIVDTQNGVDNTLSGPATTFKVNPSVASRLGFTPQEVAEDATSLMDGLAATDPMIIDGRPYTVRIRMGEDHRSSLQAIEDTVFNSASGKTATLGAMADVVEMPPQNEIRRENLKQVVQVSGRLEGSDLGGAMAKVKKAVAALNLPPTVTVEYGGTFQEQQKSFADLGRVLVLALALVFGVLLFEFRNFSAPFAILTSSVLSIAGVVFALLLTNTGFNVASFMGLIMVIGIVAKNGILLLDADERARAQGAGPLDAMLHAAQRRLRPIVMTAVAAMCGMLPLAFALGSGSQMLQPLAISVIGGLVISVGLSLIVTPAIYYQLTAKRHEAE